jgi:hypothetical protein
MAIWILIYHIFPHGIHGKRGGRQERSGINSIKIWKVIHITHSVILTPEAHDLFPFDRILLELSNYRFLPAVNAWHGFRSSTSSEIS